jgi:hypothetical protein
MCRREHLLPYRHAPVVNQNAQLRVSYRRVANHQQLRRLVVTHPPAISKRELGLNESDNVIL